MGMGKTWSIPVLCVFWSLTNGFENPHNLRPVCQPSAGDRCSYITSSLGDYFYNINGASQIINFQEGRKFSMPCSNALLNDSAVPLFPRRVTFQEVILKECPPPEDSISYVEALARLNVTVLEKLMLEYLPNGTQLTRAAFADLPESVFVLDIAAVSRIDLEPDTLMPLKYLKKLWLTNVRPVNFPKNLTSINLRNTGLISLPDLPDSLESLQVVENTPINVTPLSKLDKLRQLHLSAPLDNFPPLPAGLENLTLVEIRGEWSPGSLQQCARLRRLAVLSGPARPPPPGWLAPCPRLDYLFLQNMNYTKLPDGLLKGASQLRELHITFNELSSVPGDLFEYSPAIKVVDLSHNKLKSLPSDVFAPLAARLESLDLSSNGLRAAAVCAALRPLAALSTLSLSNNDLGDLCDPLDRSFQTQVWSCFSYELRQSLALVRLSRARLTRVCADWLRDMPRLRRLDLTHNNITALQLSELNSMKREQPSVVDVNYNWALRTVAASEHDYDAAAGDRVHSKGTILMNSVRLTCNCSLYWFARALRERRVAVSMAPTCVDAAGAVRAVRTVPYDQLVCALEAAACAPCSCASAPVVRGLAVRCARAPPRGLLRRLPARVAHLDLSGAGLTAFPDDLPDGLAYLNLDNNSISRDEGAAGAPLARALQVRLTRNPLACACGRGSLLPLLRHHRYKMVRWNETTCADGRLVDEVAERCDGAGEGAGAGLAGAGGAGALGALAAAAAAGAALVALLARPHLRSKLKAWVRDGGGGGARPYDVFVAHAAADARFVATHLVPHLERRGYKVLVKERDWPVGAWIPAQIEASVAAARCTLGVLPAAGAPADCGWLRAELRAAAAAALRGTARLVLVARGAAAPAGLRAHRTLRWADPAFRRRLLRALPPPTTPVNQDKIRVI